MITKIDMQNMINGLDNERVNELIHFMNNRGFSVEQWVNVAKAKRNILTALNSFFDEVAVGSVATTNEIDDNKDKIDFEKVKNKAKENKNSKVINLNKKVNDGLSKTETLRRYKTIDNLIGETEKSDTTIENVKQITENTYACYMTGSDLVSLFLNKNLVYDPNVQRGVKEGKNGEIRASFKEKQIRDIRDAIANGSFTPTLIQLGVIIDREDNEYNYDKDSEEFNVSGKIIIIDGQHRIKSLVLVHSQLMFGMLENVDLDSIMFSVYIHTVTTDEAVTIYRNIDKNLRLDKSQSRQLSSDHYARIANFLNQSSDSDLKGKIATSKPVGSKLVLFSNFAEAIQKNITINTVKERENIAQYLMNFFNYLADKLPVAFGDDYKKRSEFRENNLLNENNFFPTWIRVAFLDVNNYKSNIDKIIDNINKFNKDYKDENEKFVWLEATSVKVRQNKDGFAMNNTNTGIKNMIDITLNILGYGEPIKDGDSKNV